MISASTLGADVRRGGYGAGVADRFTLVANVIESFERENIEAMPKISYREILSGHARC
jgi:hypothetical protein